MSSADRKILEKELARFFGFDNADDASDILDSLLSIESNELLEYLSSLLGPSSSATDDICRQTFVINLQKWKNGEAIESTSQTVSSSNVEEKEESVEQKYNVTKKENKPKLIQNRNNKNRKAQAKEMRRKKATKQNRNTNVDVKSASTSNTQKQEVMAPKKSPVTPNITKPQIPVQKPISVTILDYSLKISNLPKGEAKITCGCFGTFHKPLTNCLYCGRIACIREEECTFCPSCNRMLIHPSSLHTIFGTTNIELENAIQHKNKLLRYENEQSKKRTEVYDDEKDYYSNKTSMWLTKEERLDSEQREELRRKELHERKKALLKDFF